MSFAYIKAGTVSNKLDFSSTNLLARQLHEEYHPLIRSYSAVPTLSIASPPANPISNMIETTERGKSHSRKAPLALEVVVVGCGLGGLAAAFCLGKAGHKVTVLEASPVIGEIGAGIQVTPNVSRLLLRWGLGPKLDQVVVKPQAFGFRRFDTGELIGWTPFGDTLEKTHGAPYYHIHRADYHTILYEIAKPHMDLRLNSKVVSVDVIPAPQQTSVSGASNATPKVALTLQFGDIVYADMIIGADGIKSMLRDLVVGSPDRPVATGDAAYRAIIPAGDMLKDPVLRHLIEDGEMTGWMGPNKHIMGYCLRQKKEYNLVMAHPDDGSTESWTAEASTEKMREDFKGWEPRIQKLLALVQSTLNWKLMDRAPLSTWVHKDGRIALLGDACHPMLPYRAQGAAMAIEDAATLGVLFSRITDYSQITPLLHAYQRLRYDRTSSSQLEARMNQRTFHHEDGPEQERRDASMKAAMKLARAGLDPDMALSSEDLQAGNANMWADKSKNVAQFSHDAEQVAEDYWEEEGRYVIGGDQRRLAKL